MGQKKTSESLGGLDFIEFIYRVTSSSGIFLDAFHTLANPCKPL